MQWSISLFILKIKRWKVGHNIDTSGLLQIAENVASENSEDLKLERSNERSSLLCVFVSRYSSGVSFCSGTVCDKQTHQHHARPADRQPIRVWTGWVTPATSLTALQDDVQYTASHRFDRPSSQLCKSDWTRVETLSRKVCLHPWINDINVFT